MHAHAHAHICTYENIKHVTHIIIKADTRLRPISLFAAAATAAAFVTAAVAVVAAIIKRSVKLKVFSNRQTGDTDR